MVHGSRGAYGDPQEPYDASWERNRALVLEAEQLGYDLTLFAQHTVNPRDDSLDELEPWTAAAALAAVTERIELVVAIKPLLYHPVVLAKLALQIEHISRGRLALNVVNAWNKAEFEDAGITFPPHDERYQYGREWLSIVEPLLRGERVNHEGPHFRVRDYQLRPAGTDRPRPRIYAGGESEPARELVAERGDVWFINGRPLDEVEPLLADLRRRPRNGQPPLRFALSAFVIARPTAAEAHEHYEYLQNLADEDARRPRARPRNVDPEVVMHQVAQRRRSIGTNGASAAGLIGSYDEVATRIRAFGRAGIETFLLMFQPFEADMRRFAQHVMPGLR